MGLNSTGDAKTLTEEKIFTKPITVTNKVGGSGDVGWKYTKQKVVTYWRLTQAYS